MSAVEKILKKVEQDRSKGNDERALTRLRDGHGDVTLELRLGETSDGGGANLLDALIVALQPGAAPQTELVELPAQ